MTENTANGTMNDARGQASLPDLLLQPTAAFFANPYPFYRAQREVDPVVWAPGIFGIGAWVVTSHAFCAHVLKSPSYGMEVFRVLSPSKLMTFIRAAGKRPDARRGSMLFHDPPDHTRLRRLVSRLFTPAAIEQMRGRVTAVTHQLLDALEGREEADLVADFAFPLPVLVITQLLGIPASDLAFIKKCAVTLVHSFDPVVSPHAVDRSEQTSTELAHFLNTIIEERRRTPQDDLITELVSLRDAGDQLSATELLATCILLLIAGHENSQNLIGNGALAILHHDEVRQAIASNPRLSEAAAEECMRFDSPSQGTLRICLEDTHLGPHRIRAGDLVLLLIGAANHDPAQFERVTDFLLDRANVRSHLSLGVGMHFCLGQALGRLEAQIAFEALVRRFPRLRLRDGATPQFKPTIMLRGLESLNVRLH